MNQGEVGMTDKRENDKPVVPEVDRAELARIDGGWVQLTDGCGHVYSNWWNGKNGPPPSLPGWEGLGPDLVP